MVMRKGYKRKTKHKLRKHFSEKGKLNITRFMQEFKIGDKVRFAMDPGYQKGAYHPRFHWQIGTIEGKQGGCFKVSLKDGGKMKMFVLHPIHLAKHFTKTK